MESENAVSIDFNPLHREGGDTSPVLIMSSIKIFQSTPPRGWRRISDCLWRELFYFNPLHREGGDYVVFPVSTRFYDFNPLHREGGDSKCDSCGCFLDPFQSTPPRGWRRSIPSASLNLRIFQSTPPRGWRLFGLGKWILIHNISIHSTARVETAILHNNHYYSSSHFHKQIISHPPQITANHPCTLANPFSLCKFSGANPPVNPCLLQVRTKILYTALPPAARSEYQRFFHINPLIHPNMVHFCSVFIPKVVKPKAVRLFINYICQYRL